MVVITITPKNIIPEIIKCSLKFSFFRLKIRKLFVAKRGIKDRIINFELLPKKASMAAPGELAFNLVTVLM